MSIPEFDVYRAVNYTVQKGDTALMPCTITNLANESVSPWFKELFLGGEISALLFARHKRTQNSHEKSFWLLCVCLKLLLQNSARNKLSPHRSVQSLYIFWKNYFIFCAKSGVLDPSVGQSHPDCGRRDFCLEPEDISDTQPRRGRRRKRHVDAADKVC